MSSESYLQGKSSEPSNERGRHANPQGPLTHQLRRSARERHRRASITTTSRRRRPRWWVRSCRCASQVLHLEVAASQRLTKSSVADELTNIEGHAVVGEVAVLRRDGEVGGLLEHNDIV